MRSARHPKDEAQLAVCLELLDQRSQQRRSALIAASGRHLDPLE